MRVLTFHRREMNGLHIAAHRVVQQAVLVVYIELLSARLFQIRRHRGIRYGPFMVVNVGTLTAEELGHLYNKIQCENSPRCNIPLLGFHKVTSRWPC